MTSRDPYAEDGPELVPPAELLRLRAELARPPGPEIRAQHLAATAMAARQRGHHPMGRFASRSARGAVAIVAALAITSGLAGAQLLPDQAQRLLSNVSDRFAPTDGDPPAEPAAPGDATTTMRAAPRDPAPIVDKPADATTSTSTTVTTEEPVGPGTTSATTSPPPPTSTTIPGPAGPGSPDDPTDPDPTTTTTVAPTTTTTVPPTTTTTGPTTTTTTGGGTP